MVPICTGDNTSLPGTDVLIAPERCKLMMDRNNPIILTFVFANLTPSTADIMSTFHCCISSRISRCS